MDDTIKAELQELKTIRDQNPGVYVIYLIDADGLGPSWKEWIPVLRMLESYASLGVESDDVAMQIDLVRHKAKRNRHFFERRKYLLTDSDEKKYEIIWTEKRRTKLFEFIHNIRRRIGSSRARRGRRHPTQETSVRSGLWHTPRCQDTIPYTARFHQLHHGAMLPPLLPVVDKFLSLVTPLSPDPI